MPGRDGTGPLGLGALRGRGLGACCGRGLGRGAGRLGAAALDSPEGEAERLRRLKTEFEQRLQRVNARLEQIKPKD